MWTYFKLRAGRADVTLTHPLTLPTERILTSGRGGGITFRIDPRFFPRLRSTLRVRPADLGDRMRDLLREGVHHHASRGIHGAALALQRGTPTSDRSCSP